MEYESCPRLLNQPVNAVSRGPSKPAFVRASGKGVAAAEKTRIFREKDLDAEKKKFDNGMSTNFLVLSKLNDLNTAKGNELQAQITYAKSVTALEKAMGHLLEARKFEVK